MRVRLPVHVSASSHFGGYGSEHFASGSRRWYASMAPRHHYLASSDWHEILNGIYVFVYDICL